jgi:hypothetical protein
MDSNMKLHTKVFLVSAATVATALAFTQNPAMAQDTASASSRNSASGSSESRGMAASANPATINEILLKQTAHAYAKVRQISENELSRLKEASDDAARQHIAEQAEVKKLDAVRAEGLQPEQYNHVIQLVLDDKGLEQRFLSYVNQTS